MHRVKLDAAGARSAAREEIPAPLHEASEEILAVLLENPSLDEDLLCRLLERKNLSTTFLERIGQRKEWLASYRVKRAVAFHPHAPRLLAMRLARELFLMDLVQLSLLPAAAGELKRVAEQLILARLPQLPLGQKLTLARRASDRVAGALLAEGKEQVARSALGNAFLTEAQVLKALSREKLPAPVVAAIAAHPKWSQLYNVRVALVRHPNTPLARVLAFLPHLTARDLHGLRGAATISQNLRNYLAHEIARRSSSEGWGAGPERRRRRRRAPSSGG